MFKNKTILVADGSESIQRIQKAFGSDINVIGITTLYEATHALNYKPDLVICGLHFDESRMFDFLRIIKTDPLYRAIPVFCFRDFDSRVGICEGEALKIACLALGAVDFVDLYDLRHRYGAKKAGDMFRKLLVTLLEDSNLPTN